MTSKRATLCPLSAAFIGVTAFTLVAYRRDLKKAIRRVETNRNFIDSPEGRIEYAEEGDGTAVLFVHGAGGGFDQGLELGRAFLGAGHRIIAPSRFGYLGTPVPADATPEAQADAYARLLDALRLERVPVIGVSAGSPSAVQFCLRHPDRCSALALIVPLAFNPERAPVRALSPFFEKILTAISSSDLIFWASVKFARETLMKTILGTPPQHYRSGSAEDRRAVDEMLATILPMSRRSAGIRNDGIVASTLKRYELEKIAVPTLVISTEDCLYGTYPSARYTAEHIAGAKFVGFSTGGHLLLGHEDDVRWEIAALLNEATEASKRAASAREESAGTKSPSHAEVAPAMV